MSTTVPTDIYVARQAIFDSGLSVRGYELLFRSSRTEDEVCVVDHEIATAQVILNTFLDIESRSSVSIRPFST